MSVCQSASRVQLLKNRFESLNSSPVTIRDDTSVVQTKPKILFQRSKTSLQLTRPSSNKEPLKQVKSAPRLQQRPALQRQLGQQSGGVGAVAVNKSNGTTSTNVTSAKQSNGVENRPFLRQTDDIRRASIKRSPAFRERSSQRVKSSAPNPPVPQPRPNTVASQSQVFDPQVEEAIRRNPNVNLTDTLKKALCQPLPLGPPPKKPPRSFEIVNKPLPPEPSESPPPKIEVIQINSKPINGSVTVRQVASDKISTFVDNNFLSCFSCTVKDPVYDTVARDQPIYMQPFGHLKQQKDAGCSTSSTSPHSNNNNNNGVGNNVGCAGKHNEDNNTDLHYMCTSISDSYPTEDEKSSMSSITTYDQINLLVDAAFCEINQLSDELEEEERQKKAHMARLTRSLTEKRKDYVRRTVTNREKYKKDVRSIYGTVHKGFQLTDIASEAGVDASSIVPISERLNRYKELMEASVSDGNKSPQKNANNNPNSLFQVCLLVGYNITTNQPYIRWKFPPTATAPDNVEEMVFPSKDMLLHTDNSNQNFSLVFTDLDGNRLYGFCRRVLPEGSQVFLPLIYCMVTTHLAPDFYFKVLQEVEIRHGHSDTYITSMLKALYPLDIPHAGEVLTCPLPELPQPAAILTHANRHSKRLSLELNPKWLSEVRLEVTRQQAGQDAKKSGSAELSELPDNSQLSVRRPKDLRLEHSEISELHRWLGADLLVAVFGTLLHERKLIFYSRNINKLSSCVLGLQAILYPFIWQYPMITVLPDHLIDICQAPIPIIIGTLQEVHVEIEDGIVINLDTKRVVQQCGDENMILPQELRHSLHMSLDLVDMLDQGKTLSNVLIAEAFLRFFVELLQGYDVKAFEVS